MNHIFILSTNSLFSVCLEMMLNHRSGIQIVGKESKLDTAITAIDKMHTDLVIVVSNNHADDPVGTIERILKETQADVLAINLENTTVQVYSENKETAQEFSSLAQEIQKEITTISPGTSPIFIQQSGEEHD